LAGKRYTFGSFTAVAAKLGVPYEVILAALSDRGERCTTGPLKGFLIVRAPAPHLAR
jgi:hypothetical protein